MKFNNFSPYIKSLNITHAESKYYVFPYKVELGVTCKPPNSSNLDKEYIINTFTSIACQLGLQS